MGIDVSVVDRVATITLNRPEAMNSIDLPMRGQLHEAWQRVSTDDEILVALVTGAGDRAFCTGGDLKAMPPEESYASKAFGSHEPVHLLDGLDTDKPLVCAINGFAIGGGLEIALACDIRIAAPHAKFGMAEVRVGSIPGSGGTQMLPRVVGRSRAMHMLLTGDQIDAETAHHWGLITEVVELDQLLDRAREIALRIATNAPLSVRAVKRLVNRGGDVPLASGIDMERFVFGLLRDSEDRIEGRRAFQEKRPPQYRGR